MTNHSDATRLLLFADAPRPTSPATVARLRRYRLARLQVDAPRRDDSQPRYAYLKRSYD